MPRLHFFRDQRGFSQAELARLAKLSKTTVMKAEQGREIRGSSARALARALKVKLEDLRTPA